MHPNRTAPPAASVLRLAVHKLAVHKLAVPLRAASVLHLAVHKLAERQLQAGLVLRLAVHKPAELPRRPIRTVHQAVPPRQLVRTVLHPGSLISRSTRSAAPWSLTPVRSILTVSLPRAASVVAPAALRREPLLQVAAMAALRLAVHKLAVLPLVAMAVLLRAAMVRPIRAPAATAALLKVATAALPRAVMVVRPKVAMAVHLRAEATVLRRGHRWVPTAAVCRAAADQWSMPAVAVPSVRRATPSWCW